MSISRPEPKLTRSEDTAMAVIRQLARSHNLVCVLDTEGNVLVYAGGQPSDAIILTDIYRLKHELSTFAIVDLLRGVKPFLEGKEMIKNLLIMGGYDPQSAEIFALVTYLATKIKLWCDLDVEWVFARLRGQEDPKVVVTDLADLKDGRLSYDQLSQLLAAAKFALVHR